MLQPISTPTISIPLLLLVTYFGLLYPGEAVLGAVSSDIEGIAVSKLDGAVSGVLRLEFTRTHNGVTTRTGRSSWVVFTAASIPTDPSQQKTLTIRPDAFDTSYGISYQFSSCPTFYCKNIYISGFSSSIITDSTINIMQYEALPSAGPLLDIKNVNDQIICLTAYCNVVIGSKSGLFTKYKNSQATPTIQQGCILNPRGDFIISNAFDGVGWITKMNIEKEISQITQIKTQIIWMMSSIKHNVIIAMTRDGLTCVDSETLFTKWHQPEMRQENGDYYRCSNRGMCFVSDESLIASVSASDKSILQFHDTLTGNLMYTKKIDDEISFLKEQLGYLTVGTKSSKCIFFAKADYLPAFREDADPAKISRKAEGLITEKNENPRSNPDRGDNSKMPSFAEIRTDLMRNIKDKIIINKLEGSERSMAAEGIFLTGS